jgi:hypothetical protein
MKRVLGLAAAALLVGAPVSAQMSNGIGRLVGAAAVPFGAFAEQIDAGWGGGIAVDMPVAMNGSLAIRLDAMGFQYGHEEEEVVFTPGPRRVTGKLTTRNNLGFITLGPEFRAASGPIRPYAHAFAGVGYMWTQSELRGSSDSEPFATTVNHDDASFAWGGGAGLTVPLFSTGSTSIALDLGARFADLGRPEYVTEGGVQDEPNGDVTVTPVRTRVQLAGVHLGVGIGF